MVVVVLAWRCSLATPTTSLAVAAESPAGAWRCLEPKQFSCIRKALGPFPSRPGKLAWLPSHVACCTFSSAFLYACLTPMRKLPSLPAGPVGMRCQPCQASPAHLFPLTAKSSHPLLLPRRLAEPSGRSSSMLECNRGLRTGCCACMQPGITALYGSRA